MTFSYQRLISLVFVILLVLAARVCLADDAASSNLGDINLATTCPSNLPPGDPGDYAGHPGNWWNKNRYGTGWSFLNANRPNGVNEMVVKWHTFGQNGRPVWLMTSTSPFTIEPNGERRWESDLHEISYDAQTLTATPTVVGHVSLVFPQGSTTRAAIRWQWDAVDTNEHDECIYNYFRESSPANGPNTSGSVNEAYTSAWNEAATPGWGLNFEAGLDLSNNYAEASTVEIYDSQGKAMWLYAQTNSNAWLPLTWQQSDINYIHASYQIDSDCDAPSCIQTTAFSPPTHGFGRQFNSPFDATFLVKAAGTVAGQTFSWPPTAFPAPSPNPPLGCPSGNPCRPMTRLTDGEQILVSQTQCNIPAGASSCSLLVSWISSPEASIHRKNIITNATTQIGTGVSGEVTETLVPGNRFRYLIKKAGVATFVSPEVKAITQAGPSADITPVLPSIGMCQCFETTS